jgi:ferrous iron transport protein B
MLSLAQQEVNSAPALRQPGEGLRNKIVIVGAPNVGKSVLFNRLSGAYVSVSNYPGTTVEVARGTMQLDGQQAEVVDTPGMYSLLPVTEEERVARRVILQERPSVVVHVIEARNLERQLPLTFQLIEAELPLVVALNIVDELEASGLEIDAATLERELGVPVVPTVSATGRGLDALRRRLAEHARLKNKIRPPS